jgi:hypothetical protein
MYNNISRSVHKYSTIDGTKSVAIKIGHHEDTLMNDIKIIKLVENKYDYLVESYVITDDIIVMECMDDTLLQLIKMNINGQKDIDIYDILKKIIDMLCDLYKNDLLYLDLKLTNILYKYVDDKLLLYLCDMESIILEKNGQCTFPTPNKYNKNSFCVDNINDKDIVWSFGVLILCILTDEFEEIANVFSYTIVDTEICKEFISNKIKEYPRFANLIEKTMAIEESDRLSLLELQKYLNFE